MRQILLVFPLIMLLLASCAASAPTLPLVSVETEAPTMPANTESAPKLPAAPFESQTYIDEAAGFALDYPAGWVVNEQVVGPRGSQVQFLSSPELAHLATLPEGATRVSATLYDWEPKNDLAAYVATRRTAWESSGFMILEEEQLVLELGLPAVRFTVQTPEATAVFLFAAIGDRYLELGGEGDLELVKEIVQRVRPISSSPVR